jgi:hypothetical protein
MQSVETNFTDVPEQTTGLKKVAQNMRAALPPIKWHPKPSHAVQNVSQIECKQRPIAALK